VRSEIVGIGFLNLVKCFFCLYSGLLMAMIWPKVESLEKGGF
jgi:hypothetical protein